METVRPERDKFLMVSKVVGGERRPKKTITWRPEGKFRCAQERR
jgi:hypothetical protein